MKDEWGKTITKTRFEGLGYSGHSDVKHWQFRDMETNRGIGPVYPTRAEMLADLVRVAEGYGFKEPDTQPVARVVMQKYERTSNQGTCYQGWPEDQSGLVVTGASRTAVIEELVRRMVDVQIQWKPVKYVGKLPTDA